ncbi:MAG: hypothetical protein QNJ69_03465 [Gammaproteobacteria bacterium]|nr:hypothetical protein [Gammaproteobacteria bacterium]
MSEKSASEQVLYRVVLFSVFKHKGEASEIHAKVAEKFKLNEKEIAHMFASRPVVIKNNIQADVAFKLHITLSEIGALSYIEPVPDIDDTDGTGYIERRIVERREQKERRAQTRIGQVMPDRRIDERREGD